MLILWNGWLLITYSCCVMCFLSCSSCKLCSLFFFNNCPSSSCTLIWGYIKKKHNAMSYALFIIHHITDYFFPNKYLHSQRRWMQQENENHVKTSVTVDFSFKSSCAFSAASQAFFSPSFSAKTTSASFCINKKCHQGHTFLGISIRL